MKKISSLIKESTVLQWVFFSALFLFFFADAANKILAYKGAEFSRVSIIVRVLYEFIFLSIILFFINKSRFHFLLLFILWFFVFFLGQYLFSLRVDYAYNFFENINVFNKYFFVLIIYYALYRYQYFPHHFKRLLMLLEWLFLINSILIIVSFLFNINAFSTYIKNATYTTRFGYSGLIPAQNDATLFMFIAIMYFYHKHFIEGVRNWKLFCVLASALFLGTKGIYFFLLLLFLFHFWNHSTANARRVALVLFLILITGVYFFLTSGYSKFALRYYMYRIEHNGFLFTFFSGRNVYLTTRLVENISCWNPLNFFIGGQDQVHYQIEMDFIDIFLFFGLIGSIIFLSLYFKTIFRFSLKKPFYKFFVFCFCLMGFFMGHFFISAINALYLPIVCLYFFLSQQYQENFLKTV